MLANLLHHIHTSMNLASPDKPSEHPGLSHFPFPTRGHTPGQDLPRVGWGGRGTGPSLPPGPDQPTPLTPPPTMRQRTTAKPWSDPFTRTQHHRPHGTLSLLESEAHSNYPNQPYRTQPAMQDCHLFGLERFIEHHRPGRSTSFSHCMKPKLHVVLYSKDTCHNMPLVALHL
jgi:hypothetical protein